MNPWVSYKMSQRFRQVNSGDAPGVRVGLHLNQVPSPSSTLLLAEGRVTPEFNKCNPAIDSAYSVVYPHHDKLNALFVDGHVASFTYPELNAQWNQLYRF
jgi:prepilin-type processing-associated H-X9-DG protein